MKISIKGLKDKIWKTIREAVLLRDGYRCQVCGSMESLQVDHCFSRSIKILFFDIRNLTTLCAKDHTHKSFRKGQAVDKKVDEIVRKREGYKGWNELMHKSYELCPHFSQRWYLEERLKEAEEKLDYYRVRS